MKKEKNWTDVMHMPWSELGKGIYVKILNIDEETGSYTRLLKFDAGAETKEVSVHDFWEEAFIIKGTIIDESIGAEVREGSYVCRAPGTKHGPFRSPNGCLIIEFTYR
jgi:anti-sigma factor ChrR (cupin superfamily)